MGNKSEIQIFLAHANEDKEEVFKLYDRLKEAGYKPWMDKKDLLPGQNWRSVIPKVIEESQLFVACFSKRSIAKQGFVQQEFKMALTCAANRPPDSIYFIPLRLDECKIPDLRNEESGIRVRDLHLLDYWENDGFDKLEKAIELQYGPFEKELEHELKEKVSTCLDLSKTNSSPVTEELLKKKVETEKAINGAKYFKQLIQEVEKDEGQAKDFTEDLGNGIKLEIIAIPEGTFFMGSPEGEGSDYEKPQHEITVSSFYMGKYPITQAQYRQVIGKNPSNFEGDHQRPVEQVSWNEAVDFCNKLSKKTGREYRLPTEAEWEYAARSRTTTKYYFGNDITSDLANYNSSVGETTAVGKYTSNDFGLYDMHGNVWEWCQDNWHENYKNAPNDGTAWLSGDNTNKVRRGSSWFSYPDFCRSAYRSHNMHDDHFDNLGFRVVCTTGRKTHYRKYTQ